MVIDLLRGAILCWRSCVRGILFVLVVLGLCALPMGAWGSPSLLGPTGLLLTPTADTLGMAQFNLGASWLTPDSVDETVLFADAGVLPGLEVGMTQEKLEGVEAHTLLNAKFRVPLGIAGAVATPLKFSLAVGGFDLTDEDQRSTYVVASHTLGAGLLPSVGGVSPPQLSVGYGAGRFDDHVFGGISFDCSRSKLVAEYDGANVNVGAKIPLAPKLEATVAGLDGVRNYALGMSFCSPW